MNYLIKVFIFFILGLTVLNPVSSSTFEPTKQQSVVTVDDQSGMPFHSMNEFVGDVENIETEELNEPTLLNKLFLISFNKLKFEIAHISYQQIYLSVEPPPIKA